MARNRWTLALIIISLPILATVITAFRIRDLPKSHDSSKLETKTQPCENCDLKVGQKVHSVKIESDKHKYEDLKKGVREKQQLINEKTLDSKATHKFIVKNNKDDDEDDLEFPEIQTGFRQEKSKDSKVSKSESNIKHKQLKKTSFGIQEKNEDNDDDDDDDDDDIKVKSKIALKLKASVKKSPDKQNIDIKHPEIKVAVKRQKSDDDDNTEEDDNDDDDDDKNNDSKNKIQVMLKSKATEIKKTPPETPKKESKSSQEIKILKSHEHDDSDDDDDDDEDDDYMGLDNIDELFKILDMKPGSKLKKEPSNTKQKTAHHSQIKTETIEESKKKNDDTNNDDDDNDEDDDDDDKNKNKLNKTPIKSSQSKISNQKSEIVMKKPEDESKVTITQDKTNEPQSLSKDTKDKNTPIIKQSTTKETKQTKTDEKDLKLKPSIENKKIDSAKTEEKLSDTTKKDGILVKASDKGKVVDKDKASIVKKKEDKEDKKGTKSVEEHPKSDSPKKAKETEKESATPKPVEQEVKSSSHENKKLSAESKIDQTDHKDIFKSPDHKKDIKYEFEKPNAHKTSHKSFDYSEFEKMQVGKSPHKEKKKAKTSGEEVSDSREERYLKHVTDALNRRNLLKSEFEDFYAFFPTFAPNFSRIHNPECRRHGQILLRQLRGAKLWALNMLDATAKIPSGVLQGNGIQLGDFDQCLGSRARVQLDTGSVVKVQGKYCLTRLDVKAEHAELEAPVYLAQAKSLIRSRIDDPGHFVPRFSTLSWGVCVPSACDREDVEVIVKDALKHYQHKSGLALKVKVDENDCHTDDGEDWEKWLEMPTVLTLSFYGVILLLVLVATVQDFIARRQSEEGQEETDEQTETDKRDEENKEESKKQSDSILSPFSLYRTISKLIAPGSSDEIACIHGVRGIATVALLVAHKFMPVAVMPYTNRLKITETASSPLWSWCRAGWVFTDCFLLLSGALTSHRIASDDTGAVRRLFSRYFRLTPALLAVVLFYAYIWDKLSTGPMWGTFVTKNAEICEQGWWWNLLYVQNYFGLEDMCAPQTHQLALDMQLTILGGIMVWAIQSGLSFAKLLLPAAHLLSAYFRYTTVRDHRLTLLAYHGVSVSQLYRTARLSYTSTLHRCSPYLIGISLGLALQKPSKHGKFVLTLGWLTSIALSGLVVWSGHDSGSTQYRYNAVFAAQYATIAPVASAMAIAWVIYAVHCGTCDFLSRMLCWRPLVFISRLSYALYLCQFIIFITNIGTVRTAREFTLMSLIDVQEISAVILLSVVLTVTFVTPMQSLHKLFSFQWKYESEESNEKKKEESEQKDEEQSKIEKKKETAGSVRSRQNLVAHREMLEEIPEMEVEYETQREHTEGLDEIVEEEEGTIGEEEDQIDDLEIIEEEEAGEEEAWLERGERSYSRQDDQDLDEWEWTANGSGRSGAQHYRYAR